MWQACAGYVCSCTHRYKLHIQGDEHTLNKIFPKQKWTHLCAGIFIICLFKGCRGSLVLPAQQSNIVTQGPNEAYKLGFSSDPAMSPNSNYFWSMGYTGNIIKIDVNTSSKCAVPWHTPVNLLRDKQMTVTIGSGCTLNLKIHVRERANAPGMEICTYDFDEMGRAITLLQVCRPKLKIYQQTLQIAGSDFTVQCHRKLLIGILLNDYR